MVTLTDSNTVVIEDYGIYGVDFTITTLDVANLTDAIVLDNASAIGWKLTDGSSVELSPTWTAVEAVPGVYTVTLALAHDPTKSKDIQVTVIKAPMTLIYTLPTAISNFTLPLEPTGTYDLLIDWGDGSDPEQITSGAAAKHTYAAAGTYKVTVGGNPTFTTISKGGAGGWGDPGSSNAPAFNSNNYLTAIESFGGVEFIDNINTFAYIQKNVTFPANTTDTPYIKGSVQKFFYRAKLFDQPLNHWNTTEVTSMSEMFYDAEAFNQDLNSWNVSSVTDMIRLFQNAKAFNGNISSWDVSKITSSLGMFWGAESFNQDISNWDVSSVTIMAHMFRDAVSFNQDLNNWDTSKNTTMYYMFYNAQAFNGNISSWDVSGVANMNSTFCFAGAFNQDIGSWDVSSVTAMAYLFYRCRIFNQDLSGWDVSSVTGRTGYDVDTDAWDPAYKPF